MFPDRLHLNGLGVTAAMGDNYQEDGVGKFNGPVLDDLVRSGPDLAHRFRAQAVDEGSMNENKIIAAILTIATSARELRDSSGEVGTENWRKAIKDYKRILAELDRDSATKAS